MLADPTMGFLAGSPLPAGICEFDVLGAYREAPVPLVRCETVDLEVPSSAEIVIEGLIDPDPASYEIEGPFAEFTGYVSDLPTPRPTIEVTCITHRNDPILRGTQEGNMATAVKNCVQWLGMSLPDALRLASSNPATFIGLGHTLGKLVPGYRADMVAFHPGDITVLGTWVAGSGDC